MNHSTHTIEDCKDVLRADGATDDLLDTMSDDQIRQLCDPFGDIVAAPPEQEAVSALKGVSEDLQKVHDAANASGSPLTPEVAKAVGGALLKAAGIKKDVQGEEGGDNGGDIGGG